MLFRAVILARTLALSWALFWLFFFVVESVWWHTPVPVAAAWAGLGLLFVIAALTPWRWQAPGGIGLIVIGAVSAAIYAADGPPELPLASRILTITAFGAPPLLAGFMFLRHRSTEVR